MKKINGDLLKNVKTKEMAMKYFPNFFGKDFNVTTRYNVNDLEREYLKYCVRYFKIYSEDSVNERINIQTAYEYVKTILTEHAKFQIKSKLATSIKQSYNELISTMSSYKFNYKRYNSYGALQNNTNKNILLEVSGFQPFLRIVLKNIDNYFETISEPEKIDEFYCELISKLEKIKNELDSSNEKLENAQEKYHDDWNAVNRRWDCYNYYSCTDSQLGESKKEWRLMRNNACHSILNFFRELENINKALYYGTFRIDEQKRDIDYNISQVSKFYNGVVDNIVMGPNYYCYLDKSERTKLDQQNALRKTRIRNKS